MEKRNGFYFTMGNFTVYWRIVGKVRKKETKRHENDMPGGNKKLKE